MIKISKQNKRLVFVTHTFPNYVGDFEANFIEALAETYQKKGYKVHVSTPLPAKLNRKKRSFKVNVHYFSYSLLKWIHNLRKKKLMINDKKLNPSFIIEGFLITIFWTINLFFLCKKIKPKFIHAHWAIPGGFVSTVIGKILKLPVIVSFPGSDVTLLRNSFFFRLFGKFIFKNATVLTTNSEDLKEGIVECGANPDKIKYIIYGVDSNKFNENLKERKRIREKLNIKNMEKLLLIIGRFVSKKGFEYVIKAMPLILKKFPNVKLCIVGEGILRDKLLKLAEDKKVISNIIWKGIMSPSELKSFYNAADIFINPAIREPLDGLNVTVPEAMSSQLPIIVTEVGGNLLVVKNKLNGLTVPEKNHIEIANKVIYLLKNPKEMKKISKNARQSILNRFNWDHVLEDYLKLIP